MMNERLSDWVDGELEYEESRRVLQSVMQNDADRQACELFWLIGDALRGSAAERGLDVSLSSRVMAALEAEPIVLAPRVLEHSAALPPVNRWFSAAAAAGGVAVAGWMSLSLLGAGGEASHPAVAVGVPQAVVLPVAAASAPMQEGSLGGEQAYYMAHQAAALGAPMPGVAQYIRTVGDEQVGRR